MVVPRFCESYSGICLTTEEKARKKLSQSNRRVPFGTMKTEYTYCFSTTEMVSRTRLNVAIVHCLSCYSTMKKFQGTSQSGRCSPVPTNCVILTCDMTDFPKSHPIHHSCQLTIHHGFRVSRNKTAKRLCLKLKKQILV